METEFMALNFVKNNPFFKKDAEKRMSASFCGSMSLVDETVVVSEPIRRPLSRGFRGLVSSSRSKSAFSLADQQTDTMVVEGTTVRLRRTDSTRRKEMAARRETVEILMEEIVRENRKSAAEIEAEERAASSGSDLEYGPGIVERLKAKFGRIQTGDKRRKNHKRHHSVDDILEESGGEYGSYDRRHGRQLTVPDRSTQTLDRSPRHSSGSEQLSRRASRSMADLGSDEYGDRRSLSLQRPSRREEYERQQEERFAHRLSLEDNDDMVDIRELRKMFDRPAEGSTAMAPAPWRSEARRDRFIERGRTHQTVPPNLGDSRRDAPPPRELRLTAPAAPITMDHGAEGEYTTAGGRAVQSLKKTSTLRRGDREEEREPEFVQMARRLRRATVDLTEKQEEEEAVASQKPLAIVTTAAPADPAPASDPHHLASPPAGRRDSFTGAASDVSPPPEEPKPPMRPSASAEVIDLSSSSGLHSLPSDCDSRYSSLARSERSDRPRSEASTHVLYSDLSLPRSDYSTASKVSKRSVSTEGGVRMGYCRSTSTDRKSSAIKQLVPENQDASGVAEMQRLLSKFSARKPREEEKEAPRVDALLLAAREAPAREEEEKDSHDPCSKQLQLQQPLQPAPRTVLSPEPERRRFVPTVVGIRSSDGRQLLSPTTVAPPPSIAAELLQAAAPAANVVSISVRESAPSVIYTNHRTTGSYDLQHAAQCDEDDSDVRRSSVGSTASSTVSTSSMAESLTSSGCSSSEDLAASTETDHQERPRSLPPPPPATPPRKESLETREPLTLSARYLAERGRVVTVAPPTPEDNSSFGEGSFDFNRSPVYYSSKPYGDEACTSPTFASSVACVSPAAGNAATAAAPKVEEESPAAEAAACCSPTPSIDTGDAPSTTTLAQDVSIVEIEEEEIVEEDEQQEETPRMRQQQQSVDEEECTPPVRQQEESDSEIDTDDDGEIEDIASRHLRLCLENSPMMAGDGNPIRHSLLHLAMEEDRPALLEAMSETYSFVFEDLSDSSRASTSTGIIRPPHKERRAKHKRISIASEVAGVYTYLDEQSAETEDQWREGAAVTIEDYHSMVAAEAAEAEAVYMKNMDELARWKASIAAAESAGTSSPDPMADLNSRHLVYSS